MEYNLPCSVVIDGANHPIRNKCDYRVIIDCISALNDDDLTDEEKVKTALCIFYEDVSAITNYEAAINEMYRIIGCGENDSCDNANDPKLMDWEYDFPQLAPPVSRVLGYDIRTPGKYVHWYTLVGGYMEIGECQFSTIVSIRSKRAKGKKLEQWEIDYVRKHRKQVELPKKITTAEQTILDSEW